VVLEC